MGTKPLLSDKQWAKIEPLLPNYSSKGRSWRNNREMLEGDVTLVDSTLSTIKVPRQGHGRPRNNPERLITDKAYDFDKLRKRLKEHGIDVIVPHRRDRKSRSLQDGRKLRRYRHRWIVERMISWLGNYRRLLVRHERDITVYRAFFHIACLLITLRHL